MKVVPSDSMNFLYLYGLDVPLQKVLLLTLQGFVKAKSFQTLYPVAVVVASKKKKYLKLIKMQICRLQTTLIFERAERRQLNEVLDSVLNKSHILLEKATYNNNNIWREVCNAYFITK